MNEVRSNPGGTRSVASAMRHGTVLMECVLVLPLLTLLIFAIVQFALIWYAQIMTHYAAYNAARAALVYHPGEYTETKSNGEVKFLEKSGVCWEAACQTLAWVSSSTTGGGPTVQGWFADNNGRIPFASATPYQVSILPDQCAENYKGMPAVKVSVAFDYPLHVPVIGRMIAYFEHMEDSHPSHWEITGWTPTAAGISQLDAINARHALGSDYVTLTATVLLPKLWSTQRYARRPQQGNVNSSIVALDKVGEL